MKIVATDIPKTIEDYQIALNAAFEGGKVYGAAVERSEMAEHCVEITRMTVDKAVASAISEEREACAKVVEDVDLSPNPIINMTNRLAAAAIRARGEK